MSDYFIKLAEESENRKKMLKDLGLTVGGTALGASVGYGASALLKKRYQHVLDKIDPQKRIKYLAPTAATLGGALSIAHLLRNNAKRRKKNDKQRKTSGD